MRAKAGITIAWFSAVAFALCAAPGLQAQTSPSASPAAGSSIEDSANDLSVAVGKTVLVDCAKPLKRVAIGLGDIAEATAISPTEVMVNGKVPGETSLILWDVNGGRQFFNITVHATAKVSGDSLDSLRRELRAELPGQSLKISFENGNIFLRGTVKDLTSSRRAVQIASTAGKVVNLLNVDVPPADPQILLKVRFASVDRSKELQLGINIFSTSLGNAVSATSTGQYSAPSVTTSGTATVSNDLNLFAYFPGLDFGATIEALQTKGIVEILAQPNVLAANGKEASFLAGGEYPYPVVQGTATGGAGAVTIMFKEYGVRLNFIPTITPRGTIRLQVAPEVSALDSTNSVEISGFSVPAITTRKVNTEVELADGQSFAIGGLLDNRDTETYEKIPILGDIPILGKFFQSMVKNRTNTELIVIVTPEIVAPVQAGTAIPEPKLPTRFLPPNSSTPMHTPDAKTAANTPAPAPASIPVEKLLDSMKPETPLVIESTTGVFGAASTTAPAASTSSAPQQ
ncbi:MAG: pilus assembly protein N-terminal domain-containing protein [Terracidiphilus sp.]|nr:pilus assembly protein N-terminal domain-containing protein [Terracidiphilus sp.]